MDGLRQELDPTANDAGLPLCTARWSADTLRSRAPRMQRCGGANPHASVAQLPDTVLCTLVFRLARAWDSSCSRSVVSDLGKHSGISRPYDTAVREGYLTQHSFSSSGFLSELWEEINETQR